MVDSMNILRNKKPTKKAGLKKNKYEFYITRKYKNYIN